MSTLYSLLWTKNVLDGWYKISSTKKVNNYIYIKMEQGKYCVAHFRNRKVRSKCVLKSLFYLPTENMIYCGEHINFNLKNSCSKCGGPVRTGLLTTCRVCNG